MIKHIILTCIFSLVCTTLFADAVTDAKNAALAKNAELQTHVYGAVQFRDGPNGYMTRRDTYLADLQSLVNIYNYWGGSGCPDFEEYYYEAMFEKDEILISKDIDFDNTDIVVELMATNQMEDSLTDATTAISNGDNAMLQNPPDVVSAIYWYNYSTTLSNFGIGYYNANNGLNWQTYSPPQYWHVENMEWYTNQASYALNMWLMMGH